MLTSPQTAQNNANSAHNALRALHRVLLQARFLAYTGQDGKKVAALLDDAEYLVALLMRGERSGGEFRSYLEGMGRKFPELSGLVTEFDEGTPRK